ncbi:MAG: DUF4132 domain-containing protein, partial [Sandaracinus sp.]|nr:DUF4132 domain-containing protein [Sandaracinus sp.]
MGTTIRFDAALAKLVTPARGTPARARRPVDVRSLTALWRQHVENTRAELERGRASTEAKYRGALEQLLEAEAPFDDEAVAPAMHTFATSSFGTSLADGIVELWLERHSLPVVVTRLAESSTIELRQDENGRWFSSARSAWSLTGAWRPSDVERVLVEAACGADEATYASLLEVVRTWAPKVELGPRATLLWLAPSDGVAIAETARAYLAAEDRSAASVVRLIPWIDDDTLASELFQLVVKEQPSAIVRELPDAILRLGDAAREPLRKALHRALSDTWLLGDAASHRLFARVYGAFVHPGVAKFFAENLVHPVFGAVASDWLVAHAELGLTALLAEADAKRPLGPAVRSLVRAIVRNAPELAEKHAKAHPWLLEVVGDEGRVATPDELPDVLRDPRWRRKGARPARPVLAVGVLPHEEKLDPAEPPPALMGDRPPLTTAERDALFERLERLRDAGQKAIDPWSVPWLELDRMSDEDALRAWNEFPAWSHGGAEGSYYSDTASMLARFGLQALDGVLATMSHRGNETTYAQLPRLDTPRVASVALRALARREGRRFALAWFEAHPRAAAIGLLPLALGEPSRTKGEAFEALRQLRLRHPDVLDAVAAEHGPEVVAAMQALFDFDPLDEVPKKPPKLSEFATRAGLPAVKLREGAVLGEEATRNLLEMMQFSPLDAPYAGFVGLRACLDEASLEEMLWALVDAWIAAGASTANAWPLRALAGIGGDATVRRLVPAIRRWPREKGKPRALLGVEVLSRIDSELALAALAELARNGRNKHVEALAKERLETVAAERGLTEDEIADRAVPRLDLDLRGELSVDFGARRFVARLQDDLTLRLYEGDKALKGTPRVAAGDDPVLAKESLARLAGAKKDLVTIAKTLPPHLERAMVDGRRWDVPSFTQTIVGHPIVARLARALLFGTFEGEGRGRVTSTFRFAEDGSFANVDDDPFELADDATVGIVHPLELDPMTASRWGSVFGDYQLLPCFPQLGRPVATELGAERATRLQTFARELPSQMLLGRLSARGYRAGGVDGDGWIGTYERRSG